MTYSLFSFQLEILGEKKIKGNEEVGRLGLRKREKTVKFSLLTPAGHKITVSAEDQGVPKGIDRCLASARSCTYPSFLYRLSKSLI